MKIAIFDAKEYDEIFFDKENKGRHEITYFKENLKLDNVNKAKGFDAVCGFVNTVGDAQILEKLSELGIKAWLQRSMGYNRIDLAKAKELGISVFRVPNYSAETVSEHAFALLMAANRRIVIASKRTQNGDFSLNGLQGKCLHSSVIGVIGSGKIGQGFISIAKGCGSEVIVYDDFAKQNFPESAAKLGFKFVTKDELLEKSDFISLHVPLMDSTYHMIDKDEIAKMKDGVIIINASRGRLINTTALVNGLKSGKISAAGLDVIERESKRFFRDKSSEINAIKTRDPEWAYLMEHENVIITSHQAFFSELALDQIAQITLSNADDVQKGDLSKSLQLEENGKVING